MNDLISRQAVKEWLAKWEGYIDADIIARMQYRVIDIPNAQPEITLLQATKTVLEFMELCGGTTAILITPDGERLLCDWGYVEDGLRELVRYAERREE